MEALQAVYRDAFTMLRHRAFLPSGSADFQVRFYPYAGLKSTIYQRRRHYEVRLADLLERAPLPVHYSLACILLSKLDRRLRLRPADRHAYENWSREPSVLEAHETARRVRGSKRTDPPQGATHDLVGLFEGLNERYFNGLLAPIRLGWSRSRSRSLWGHHDDAHKTIVLNRMLDSPRVPAYVVESILYHEMLHDVIPARYGRGRRRILHSRQFREAERLFADYEAAQRFLKDVAGRRIRL